MEKKLRIHKKILCIHHSSDIDGWMSGAIVRRWFTEEYLTCYIYSSPSQDHSTVNGRPNDAPSLTFFGWDYGVEKPSITQLNKYYDKIIMCDVSWTAEEMFELYTDFGSDFIWLDHHKSAIKKVNERLGAGCVVEGIQSPALAACEHVWNYFFPDKREPELIELLGKYDSFRHINTPEELTVRTFQFGARALIASVDQAFAVLHDYLLPTTHQKNYLDMIINKGELIYKYLLSETPAIRKGEFDIHLQGEKFRCINQSNFNPKNFEIDVHENEYYGYAIFRYDAKINKFRWTLYAEKTDVSIIATAFGGGGHAGASGFEISVEDMSGILLTRNFGVGDKMRK